ncbi:MAG TPA: sugar phosphate isomerase/epimerase [Microlunatus sp.]
MVKIGLQLYSVRESLRADPWGSLARVADAGFRYVEAANHHAGTDDGVGFDVPAAELRSRLDDLGLTIVGCHVNPLDPERLPAVLDYHQQVGNSQIGCDIEFYPYGDRDYLLRRAELFNTVGRLCRERGMRFYYHNHYQEFQRFGDRSVYELIMDNTDPDLVFIQLDTYWAYRGGQDAVALIRRYADRLVLLHQKDFPADATEPLNLYDGVVDPQQQITMQTFDQAKDPATFTEVGTGRLPIQDIIDAADAAPRLDYLLLEQDHSQHDEFTSIKISRDAFARYRGISWQ